MHTSAGISNRFGFRLSVAALLSTAALLALTGCGIGLPDSTQSTIVAPAIQGKAMGGNTPIVGAEVRIYATGYSSGASTGYGVATLLQEATQVGSSAHQDTGSTGAFSFAGGYNCPAGQFVYVVISGGTAGSNAANPNLLLVGALGRCEDLYTFSSGNYTGYKGSFIYVNELTTIAAAYALGNFSTVTGSGTGSATVLIGSTANNNAAQVSGVSTGCVAGTGSCTTTAAAGLAHAFQNAANLVNVFTDGTRFGAYASLPGNSSAVVPQQLINTLGNILVACVNSSGGTAGDGMGDACNQIFTATTIGSNVPADTFSAMVNLAANPTLSGSTTNVASFYGIAAPVTNVYTPMLGSSSGLNDYTIAINYPAGVGITYPQSGALDINDVFYVANVAGSATAPGNVVSFNTLGSVNAGATNSNFKQGLGISLDALGNGYFGNGSSSGNNAIAAFTTSGGVPSAITPLSIVTSSQGTQLTAGLLKAYATAIDLQNNLWVYGASNSGTAPASTTTLYQCPPSFNATSNCTYQYGSTGGASSSGALLAVDPNQNIWSGSTASLAVMENTGTVLAPTYATTTSTASTGPNPVLGIAFTGSASDPKAFVSGYKTGSPGIQPITYTQSGVGVTGITAGTTEFGGTTVSSTVMTGPYGDYADGNGTVWVADYNDHAIFQTTPAATSPTSYRIIPCLGGSTTCSTIFTSSSGATKPISLAVDSTGTIWVASVYAASPYSGQVVEIIGSAAPTWPLLSLGKTGKP